MNKKFKSIKVKLYHKLINNKLIYDNKPLNRYNNNVNNSGLEQNTRINYNSNRSGNARSINSNSNGRNQNNKR